jgi:hypothetical protein
MTSTTTRRNRPAFAIACLALLFAVSGMAYAATVAPANSVRSSSIRDGEVYSRDVHNRTIKGLDVLQGSLGSAVIGDGSISRVDLADNVVGSSELGTVYLVEVNSTLTQDADGVTNGGLHGVAHATAGCPTDSRLLGGGVRWINNGGTGIDDENVYVQHQQAVGQSWQVDGVVDVGAAAGLQMVAQALCLAGDIVPT